MEGTASLETELLEMGFEQSVITKVLKMSSDKEGALNLILQF